MNDLKFSIVTLFGFVVGLLGISNVRSFEERVIDFNPVFFVLVAVILFSELLVVGRLIGAGVRLSQYSVVVFWMFIYGIIWFIYLREDEPIGVNLVQLLLILLTAVLAFDVGRRIDQTAIALEGLASSAYPNRARDIQSSRDLITAEIARSRRYHHPLSVLSIQLEKNKKWGDDWKEMKMLADEMFERFAIAKVSRILSDHARTTDLVLRDKNGRFILLCPETNLANTSLLSERIAEAVRQELDAKIECGSAAFPDEALTFDDLLDIANHRLKYVD